MPLATITKDRTLVELAVIVSETLERRDARERRSLLSRNSV